MAGFALLFSALASAAASLLLRSAANGLFADRFVYAALGLRCAAVGAYGLGFISYAYALRQLPVNLAYPAMTAMAILFTVAAGSLLLGEAFSWRMGAGVLLLMAGIALIGTR